MAELIRLAQDAVEARLRGHVAAFIGENRHDLGGWKRRKARFIHDPQNLGTLRFRELVAGRGAQRLQTAIGSDGARLRPALQRARREARLGRPRGSGRRPGPLRGSA